MTVPRSIEIIHLGGSTLAGRTQTFAGALVRLGRRPDNDVVFDPDQDRKVSGHHAEIVREGDDLIVRELGAQNGVWVNGERLAGPRRVGPEDRVRLGQTGPELRLRLVDAAEGKIGEAALAQAIDQAARREAGSRRRLLLGFAAALLAVAGLLAWWLTGRSDELAERADALSAGQRDLDRKVAEAARGAAPDWAALAARYETAVFLLYAESPQGGGIGTGFVIDARGILATNAHVAQMLQQTEQRAAVQNRTGRPFRIARIAAHPGFSGPDSPDVALVQLADPPGDLPVLPLADDAALLALGPGTPLGTLGYPGELAPSYIQGADAVRQIFPGALATFKEGLVSRLTDYRSRACPSDEVRVVQHSASLSGGTSGSPMFTADGAVVAINNAGLDANVLVADPAGSGRVGAARMPSGAQIGFAIRADELRRFIAATGW